MAMVLTTAPVTVTAPVTAMVQVLSMALAMPTGRAMAPQSEAANLQSPQVLTPCGLMYAPSIHHISDGRRCVSATIYLPTTGHLWVKPLHLEPFGVQHLQFVHTELCLEQTPWFITQHILHISVCHVHHALVVAIYAGDEGPAVGGAATPPVLMTPFCTTVVGRWHDLTCCERLRVASTLRNAMAAVPSRLCSTFNAKDLSMSIVHLALHNKQKVESMSMHGSRHRAPEPYTLPRVSLYSAAAENS